MPKDNKAFARYRKILDIFQRHRGSQAVVKMQYLADTLHVSVRQLGEDLKYMREKGAPLEYVAGERGWRYQEGRDFTFVDDQILSDTDVLSIRIALETFNKINNPGQLWGDLPKVFYKIYKAARKWNQPNKLQKHIYFDPLPHYEGGKHLPFFLQAIENERRVTFQYQGYEAATPKLVLFDPWFLRHYDRRWYVGGFSHAPEEQFVRTFPLERIIDTPKEAGYFHDKPPEYDAESYWKNIYGISIPPNRTVEEVILQFSYLQGRYFLDTPFFEPFEILERDAEKLVVKLKIIPNIDLVRKLASLGAGVVVLSPASLVHDMRAFFEASLRAYQT